MSKPLQAKGLDRGSVLFNIGPPPSPHPGVAEPPRTGLSPLFSNRKATTSVRVFVSHTGYSESRIYHFAAEPVCKSLIMRDVRFGQTTRVLCPIRYALALVGSVTISVTVVCKWLTGGYLRRDGR